MTEDEIGKAYEVTKDQIIPITEDDLSGMPLPTERAVEVVTFIDAEVRRFEDSRSPSRGNSCIDPCSS
ncbi:Ku protein [Streptomyces zaomyceticus]|uniref:Ku protein n=1 Tax=Streptomyces zaomyceticus TaxID=68286 RepID=UPI0035D54076